MCKLYSGAQFYVAPDLSYMEVDVDVHAYAYLARKALQAFIPRLGSVVFETAFVIQARRAACLRSDGVSCLPAGAGACLPCNSDVLCQEGVCWLHTTLFVFLHSGHSMKKESQAC